ncbi:MAG: PAQR family membrane homeostasis protein TrhA [Actinomycetes bacterium]
MVARIRRRAQQAATAVTKPLLRGWLHVGMTPIALVGGVVLILLADRPTARWAAGIYTVSAVLLFGVSATYHRGHWSSRAGERLRRCDHANIYLLIAGTYTPFALLALRGGARVTVLVVAWGGAAAGVLFRLAWIQAPRWLYTPLYLVLGWLGVIFLPQLLAGAGRTALVLVVVGGVLYTLGGVAYGLRRPNPWPRWFGFHEVFHSFTVAAFLAQFTAVALLVSRA